MGGLRGEINKILQSELDDVDGLIAVALIGTNGLPLGFVRRGNLNISDIDLSLFSTLIKSVINRIRRINPSSWFINFKHRVITINDDQYSVIVINDDDLSIIAVFESSADINILMYRLINDLELLRSLISVTLSK
ncbi:hypothetical protein [Caldivirga sp. UBA161]|uniref:hypothetical protein n=1 Tax=Caldivirga sp. UBA161 TaxID=1915569 RepID=UPI0025C46B29|nr:hypothetical protein [Caldivirga sp. UBA161]